MKKAKKHRVFMLGKPNQINEMNRKVLDKRVFEAYMLGENTEEELE